MSRDDTAVLVDNTTLAGAGRVLYLNSNDSVPGARHAAEYYAAHPDARDFDRSSFLEFLTALVLFDALHWDSSSCTQEVDSVNDSDVWVYDWFPVFQSLKESGTLTDIDERYIAFRPETRLERSKYAAMEWVDEHLARGSYQLPKGFRIPLVYSSDEYLRKFYFTELNDKYALVRSNLAIAAFLHRGLFYQALAFSEPNLAYLPHGYRSTLLHEPTLSTTSLLCSDRLFPSSESIDAIELIKQIGVPLRNAIKKATKIQDFPARLAIGGAFVQQSPADPIQALGNAIEFRESPYGADLRRWFSELLALALASNQIPLKNRLTKMERDLDQYLRSKYGSTFAEKSDELTLVNAIPSVGTLLGAVSHALPLEWQEVCTRLFNQRVHPLSGMQLVLSRYLPNHKRKQ